MTLAEAESGNFRIAFDGGPFLCPGRILLMTVHDFFVRRLIAAASRCIRIVEDLA